MAKHEVLIGQTDYTVLIFIPDSASTDGSGKTGLVAADLTVSGIRVETDNDVTVIDYTSTLNNLASLTAAHADWGLLEVSNTLAPGLYRLDIADAIFASGAWSAVVYVQVTASAAAASPMEFLMVPETPLTGVNVSRLGGVVQSLTDLKDFADDGYDPSTNKVQGVVLTDTLTTYTGNTPQTGDNFAIVNSGTFGNSALKTLIDTLDNFVDTEVASILTAVDTEIATLVTGVAAIEVDTQDIQSRLPAALVDSKMSSTIRGATGLDATLANLVSDYVLRRNIASTEAVGAGPDSQSYRSLYGAVSKLVNLISTIETANKLTMYQTDDTTVLGRQTLTTDAAALPITVADTD